MKIVWEQGNFEPMEGPQKEPGSDQTFYLSPFFFLLFDSNGIASVSSRLVTLLWKTGPY